MGRILTIDLLRHGETEGGAIYRGRTDSQLTGTGRQQMLDQLSRASQTWQLVVSSPLQRCLEVAERFSSKHGLKLLQEDRLREIDFGVWDGMTFEQVWQEYPEASTLFWQDPKTSPPPQGETIEAFASRIHALLNDLSQQPCDELLLITHGGVIRAIVAEILGIQPNRWSRLSIAHGSLSRIRIGLNDDLSRAWCVVDFIGR